MFMPMKQIVRGVIAVTLCVIAIAFIGCASGGNARADQTAVTRLAELKQYVGKEVTLVGTARYGNAAEDSRLDLRGGSVDLPAYRWPDGYVNHPVSVTATVFDA